VSGLLVRLAGVSRGLERSRIQLRRPLAVRPCVKLL